MSRDYWTCPIHRCNLDHGEKCQECEEEQSTAELAFVTVPNDYGTHDRNLYEEVIS